MKPDASLFAVSMGGLLGAAGVALAAVAAHGTGDSRLAATAAGIALVHAPCLLALAALAPSLMRFRLAAVLLIVAGTILFSGDLAARFFFGDRLFADAAPFGGMLLIAGWLAIAAGAVAAGVKRRSPPSGGGAR